MGRRINMHEKFQNGDFRHENGIVTEIFINGQWYSIEEADKLVFEIQGAHIITKDDGGICIQMKDGSMVNKGIMEDGTPYTQVVHKSFIDALAKDIEAVKLNGKNRV